ncbi:MAG: hypothetical protein ACREOZ_02130 [Gloeomargaritales cyanobacterium]
MKLNRPAMEHAGESLHKILENQLLEDMRRYLEMREVPPHYSDNDDYVESEKILARQRGIVRGTARALLLWRNVYQKDSMLEITAIEKEFVRRVKNRTVA